MKKVAGTLRIELAQYRELEAFAKFGSDLDPATQRQLRRGERLVEVLKQGQYRPMPVEEQIAIIFVATQGLLDPLPVHQVRAFEQEFLERLRLRYAEQLKQLAHTGELSDELAQIFRKEAQALIEVYTSSEAQPA